MNNKKDNNRNEENLNHFLFMLDLTCRRHAIKQFHPDQDFVLSNSKPCTEKISILRNGKTCELKKSLRNRYENYYLDHMTKIVDSLVGER